MTEPLTADETSRRDDLLLMLLHGGAASNSIARHVVDALAAEVRAEQAAEIKRLRSDRVEDAAQMEEFRATINRLRAEVAELKAAARAAAFSEAATIAKQMIGIPRWHRDTLTEVETRLNTAAWNVAHAVSPSAPTAAALLSSPCDACQHTLNWHRNNVGCTVTLCVCGSFQS